jgi:hypothetical protein
LGNPAVTQSTVLFIDYDEYLDISKISINKIEGLLNFEMPFMALK